MWDPASIASVAASGASVLSGAFGGGGPSIAKQSRDQRKALQTQQKYGEMHRRQNEVWQSDHDYSEYQRYRQPLSDDYQKQLDQQSAAQDALGVKAHDRATAWGREQHGLNVEEAKRASLEAWERQGRTIQQKVDDAKAAGLHPLFAMGHQGFTPAAQGAPAQASSSGGSSLSGPPSRPPGGARVAQQGFSIPGQSGSGSFATEALAGLAGTFLRISEINAQKDLINAQKTSSAVKVAEAGLSNDTSQALRSTAHAPRIPRQLLTISNQKLDPVKRRPHDSSIEAIEESYGEVADIVGAVRFIEDVVTQSTMPAWREITKDIRRNFKNYVHQRQVAKAIRKIELTMERHFSPKDIRRRSYK